MKKVFVVILELLIIITLLSVISSKYLSYFKMKPFIVIKTIEYEYYDGKVVEYLSILHKVVEYDRDSMKKWDVLSIFKEHDNGQNDFTIIYDTDVCTNVSEEIYRDHMFSYTLPCYGLDTIKIKFESNEEMTLREALASKKVTIDALQKKRLLIDRTPIN